MKINKKKFGKFFKKIISSETIRFILLLIIAAIFIVINKTTDSSGLDSFVDISVLISFLLAFASEALAVLLLKILNQKTEDANKLTENYGDLVSIYKRNAKEMFVIKRQNNETVFPVITLAFREIDDAPFEIITQLTSTKLYELPKTISKNSETIFGAHNNSTVYNSLCIRLDDITINNKKIILDYSYTHYFDTLLTNRAMDYAFLGKITIRDLYEPGPWLSPLPQSKLSNHLGYNGFVELSDGNIIFVRRRKKISRGKQTWAQSIGASLKAAYCLDDDKKLTFSGIIYAIKEEIKSELKIDISQDKQMEKSIFAFYRDILEGGKPQFLFYYKVKGEYIDKEAFLNNFKQKKRKSFKEDKAKLTTDGKMFKFIKLDSLINYKLEIDGITPPGKKKMHMLPSSAASVAMFLEAMSGQKS